MKKLILVLFVGLLLFACKDNPMSPDTGFHGKQIGYWYMDSPKSADWTGKSINKKTSFNISSGDTILIEQPDNYSLSMRNDTLSSNGDQVVVSFADSTLSLNDFDFETTEIRFSSIDGDSIEGNNTFDAYPKEFLRAGNYVQPKFLLAINCNAQKVPPTHIVITANDKDSKFVWKLPVDGMQSTAKEIACN